MALVVVDIVAVADFDTKQVEVVVRMFAVALELELYGNFGDNVAFAGGGGIVADYDVIALVQMWAGPLDAHIFSASHQIVSHRTIS